MMDLTSVAPLAIWDLTIVTTPRKIELFDTSRSDGPQQPNLDISVRNAVPPLQRMMAW